jgi:signal transduction histidine kinase
VLVPAVVDDERPPAGRHADGLDALAGEVRLAASGRWLDVSVYRTNSPERTSRAAAVVVLRDVTPARAAALARDAFMGVLSHELRTPITTIYGGSELLERGLPAEAASEVVRDIRTESERLARLVEDLLVMSRVERGGVEIGDEPVLIQRVLPSVIGALESRSPGLKVSLSVDDGLPAVRGDATYLEQVVRNLLTNAARYGDAAGSGVEVTATAQEGGREVAVRVLDRGPGLGGDSAEKLFELFYRAPAAKRVPGGAGIGLFVCRQLVEAMGGRIWARPRPGGGAEFGFALPAIETDVVA